MMKKDTVLSASTTTGNLTLGNYIGAVRQWTLMQEQYDCFFMVANLHALTTPSESQNLKENTESFFAQYLALGLDPEKNVLFVQSQVSEHAELMWALSCLTPMGNLQRMTQFKDKSEKQKSILSGLLMYPVLMAADILLYQAKYVPVGEDQKQHIELCRDIVDFFHNRYGETFVMPEPFITKLGARIMSLTDPEAKMSKSDPNPASFVAIIDDPKTIEKKFKRAVTDSGSVIKYDPENKGIANLMTIYSVLSGKDFAAIEKHFDGKMYGHLKVEVAELVIESLRPAQEKYKDLMKNRDHLRHLMKLGANRAKERATKTLATVYDKMGIVL
jgi:tryptophanyl-tRNA synthetase